MGKLNDLTGKRFGKLTAIEVAERDKFGHIKWRCICDCGKEIITYAARLRHGKTRSCGCLVKETNKKRLTTHGMKKTRLYRTWVNMKARCNNPKDRCFGSYGGRGIKVCGEWEKSFQSFYDWAMSHGYTEELTIERKNVNGNYEPSNCCWITMTEQQKNKRGSKQQK